MNSDQLQGKWKEVKGSIKVRWGKLTDDDVDVINGRRDQLIGRIQERYGMAKEEAQKQVEEWMSSETSAHPQHEPVRAEHEPPRRKVS